MSEFRWFFIIYFRLIADFMLGYDDICNNNVQSSYVNKNYLSRIHFYSAIY